MRQPHDSPRRITSAFARKLPAALVLVSLIALSAVATAQGIDRIRRHRGTESGKISQITALTVMLSKGGVESKVRVEEIRGIDFAAEPEDLRPARLAATAGRYHDALERLGAIAREGIEREAILQEIDYWQLFCHVQLALAGLGDLSEAAREASSFLSNNRNSYHIPAVIELSGNALVAMDQFDNARTQYAKLGKAKSPYFTARSAILTGISWQQEGNHEAAVTEFDRALEAAEQDQTAQSQQLEATLHKAVSRSATGDVAEATRSVKVIIGQAKAEDMKLLSRAYNSLGDCYLQSGDEKAACDAFLHVDVLFSSQKTAHAKALYELSRLWTNLGKQARAQDAWQRLQKGYPASRWAKQ